MGGSIGSLCLQDEVNLIELFLGQDGEVALHTLAVFIHQGNNMIPRFRRQRYLMNIPGGTYISIINMPKYPYGRIAMGGFKDGPAGPTVKFDGHIQRAVFSRVYQTY